MQIVSPVSNNNNKMEEDESLVVVDLAGILEHDFLSQVKDAKILGIDSEKPLLQLDHYTFTGEYQDALGTCVLLEEKLDRNAPTDDNGNPKMKLEYHGITYKRLGLERVFIKKKVTDPAAASSEGVSETAMDSSNPNTVDVEQGTSHAATDIREDQSTLSCDTDALNSNTKNNDVTCVTESAISGRLSGDADSEMQIASDINNPDVVEQQQLDTAAVVEEKLHQPDG